MTHVQWFKVATDRLWLMSRRQIHAPGLVNTANNQSDLTKALALSCDLISVRWLNLFAQACDFIHMTKVGLRLKCFYKVQKMRSVTQRRMQRGPRGHASQSSDIFSKVRFLMSFQTCLDSIIDLSSETITFIMPCILCSFIRSLNSQ